MCASNREVITIAEQTSTIPQLYMLYILEKKPLLSLESKSLTADIVQA